MTKPLFTDAIATLNPNGGYLSGALSAQVGRHRHRDIDAKCSGSELGAVIEHMD